MWVVRQVQRTRIVTPQRVHDVPGWHRERRAAKHAFVQGAPFDQAHDGLRLTRDHRGDMLGDHYLVQRTVLSDVDAKAPIAPDDIPYLELPCLVSIEAGGTQTWALRRIRSFVRVGHRAVSSLLI